MESKLCTKKESILGIQKRNYELVLLVLTVLMLMGEYITIYHDIVPGIIRKGVILLWMIASIFYIDYKGEIKKLFLLEAPLVVTGVILLVKVGIAGEISGGFFGSASAIYDVLNFATAILLMMLVFNIDKKDLNIVMKIFIILMAVNLIPSILYCLDFGNAVRDQVDKFAIINFTILYSMLPMIGAMITSMKFEKRNRWLYLVPLLMFVLMIGMANFTTALLLCLVVIFLSLLPMRKTRFRTVILTLLALIVAFILLREPIAEMILEVANLDIFTGITQHRLTDVANLLLGVDVGSSFTSRITLMSFSWDSFLQYPVFGIPLDMTKMGVVGKHETWATMLAFDGFIGTSMIIASFVGSLVYVFKRLDQQCAKTAFGIVSIVMIVYSFLNPVFAKGNLFALFAIAPAILILVRDKGAQKQEMLKGERLYGQESKHNSARVQGGELSTPVSR